MAAEAVFTMAQDKQKRQCYENHTELYVRDKNEHLLRKKKRNNAEINNSFSEVDCCCFFITMVRVDYPSQKCKITIA